MDKYELKSDSVAKRKSHLLRKLLWMLGIVLTVLFIVVFTVFLIIRYNKSHITVKTLARHWNSSDKNKYELIYNDGKQILQTEPFNNTALVYYGYSCFYLAVSQTDSAEMQNYLDECINSLRISLYNAKERTKPQVYYMLGKAYFYKNKLNENYYADLTIKYLNEALDAGYRADDIPEYLGMSYASLGMTMESISAFSEALVVRESYNLLFSIDEQYKKNNQYNLSKQYLYRVITESENDELVERSRILLGNIYLEEEKYDEAQEEFEQVLKIRENSADAHYGIGVIYEKQGNLVKARTEWRTVLKYQVNHAGALNKLSDNKK